MHKVKTVSEIGIIKGSRVLAFFPHPDDETGFAAGFLQKCVEEGATLRVVCVTKGDKGTSILKSISAQSLAEMRVAEFKNAMHIFGVTNYEVGDFPDGGLEAVYKEVFAYVQMQIEYFKPEFVLTLEPCGIYGHPDHIALSKAVTNAVTGFGEGPGIATGAGCQLLYATVRADKTYLFNRVRKEMAKEPDKIVPLEPTIELKLSPKEVQRKIEAFRCYKSQFKPTMQFFMKWFYRSLLTYEYIHLV